MKNAGVFVALGVVGALALTVAFSTLSFYNEAVAQEKGIQAVYKDSQLQYDKFWKTVKESAQITDKYAEDFKEVFLGATDKRYVDKDPAFLFITEANPNLDPSVYQQLQRAIEAGRAEFTQSQTTLVDRQRRYETTISTFPGVALAGMFGFPSEVGGEYGPADDIDGDGKLTVLDYRIVTSAKTAETFATGREDEPLDVFGGSK